MENKINFGYYLQKDQETLEKPFTEKEKSIWNKLSFTAARCHFNRLVML